MLKNVQNDVLDLPAITEDDSNHHMSSQMLPLLADARKDLPSKPLVKK